MADRVGNKLDLIYFLFEMHVFVTKLLRTKPINETMLFFPVV